MQKSKKIETKAHTLMCGQISCKELLDGSFNCVFVVLYTIIKLQYHY